MTGSTRMPVELLQQCWFLAGPTAVGKTASSLLLAKTINAEILALDSMSLYRGMDIGTAKASKQELDEVPHHLIDFIDPHEEYSVAEYITAAAAVCEDIIARGKTPLFVGGTGLYLRGLLRGVFEGPPADWEFRNQLQEESNSESLHQQLSKIDPVSADRLHPNDVRRVIRALEVHHLTGKPLSAWHAETALPAEHRPKNVFWLEPPRDWLHERINRRVDQMFADGLVEEVRQLLAAEKPPGRTARQALGYAEVIEHLEAGISLEETVENIKAHTRQFAKRQHTWFRNLEECQSVKLTGAESATEIVDRIVQMSANHGE